MAVALYQAIHDIDGNITYVAAADVIAAAIPVGTLWQYAAATPPTSWLLCDGASYLRTLYQDLFDVIGTTWGSADGTHFNVPDMRGRSPVGAGTGTGLTARALAAVGGEEAHILSVAELASHNHTSAPHSHSIPEWQGAPAGAINTNIWANNAGGATAPFNTNSTTPANTGNNGSGTAHNTMHPFAAVTYMIKY